MPDMLQTTETIHRQRYTYPVLAHEGIQTWHGIAKKLEGRLVLGQELCALARVGFCLDGIAHVGTFEVVE